MPRVQEALQQARPPRTPQLRARRRRSAGETDAAQRAAAAAPEREAPAPIAAEPARSSPAVQEVSPAQRAADLGSLNAAAGDGLLEVPRLTAAAADADAPEDQAPPPAPLLDVEGYLTLGELGLGMACSPLGTKAGVPAEALVELQRFSEQEKALLRPLLKRAAPFLDTFLGTNLTPEHAAIGCALVYGWSIWQRMNAIKALAAALDRAGDRKAKAATAAQPEGNVHPPPAPAQNAAHIPGSPY